jgi:hypothetical protein
MALAGMAGMWDMRAMLADLQGEPETTLAERLKSRSGRVGLFDLKAVLPEAHVESEEMLAGTECTGFLNYEAKSVDGSVGGSTLNGEAENMKEEDAQGMEEKEAEGMGEKVFEEAIIEMRNLVRGVSRMSGLRTGIHKVRRIYFPNQQIQEGTTCF